LPRRIAVIAGALALAVAGSAPARTATPAARPSMRSTSRRRPACELSADLVASLHAFVLRLVPDPADAADIAQQALLLAWSDRGGSPIANVDAWLRCTARHLISNHFRAGNRYRSVEMGDALADSEPVLQTRADLPVAIRECRERIGSLLDDATGQLCLVHQIALLLSDVYDHCDKHSATLLQMSVPCYKLVLHRARLAVRASRRGPTRQAGWLGVTCPLSTAQLVALRKELLEGLDVSVPSRPHGPALTRSTKAELRLRLVGGEASL
jgi:DNA-directed RNA polymerase specialized sigma24 family protein